MFSVVSCLRWPSLIGVLFLQKVTNCKCTFNNHFPLSFNKWPHGSSDILLTDTETHRHKQIHYNQEQVIILDLHQIPLSVVACFVLFSSRCLLPQPSFLLPGLVRLQGGRSKLDGRVEVYLGGVWGSVCGSQWGDEDASVVCRQLGKGWERANTFHTLSICLLVSQSDTGESAAAIRHKNPQPEAAYRDLMARLV